MASGEIQVLLEMLAVEKTSFRSLGTDLRAILCDALQPNQTFGEQNAEHLLDRAKQSNPKLDSTDALVGEMLRLRTVRA